MFEINGILLRLLLIAALLSTGGSLAQDGAAANSSFTDAAAMLNVSEFSVAVQDASLADTLNNQDVLIIGQGSFVIFAPSDEAFAQSGLDMDTIKENVTDLKRILGYHVIWNAGLFENISEVSSAKTLQGESLTIESADGLKVNGANVTASQSYGSGIIYVIDKVLMPKSDSSQGVVGAASDAGAKKFSDAIKTAGLAETLDGQGLMGIEGMTEGPFTVFTPSDEAFDSARTSLDAIKGQEGGMMSLISYHVVDAEGLSNMTQTNSVKTMLGDSLAVDPQLGQVGSAYVLKSERYNNGIIYVIDQVLVPIRLAMV